MRDPFLHDALDGYARFDEDLSADIDFLQSQVKEKSERKKRFWLPNRKRLAIAASYAILIIGGVLTLYFLNNQQEALLSLDESKQESSPVSKPIINEDDLTTASTIGNSEEIGSGVEASAPPPHPEKEKSMDLALNIVDEDIADYDISFLEYNIDEMAEEEVSDKDAITLYDQASSPAKPMLDSSALAFYRKQNDNYDPKKELGTAEGVSSMDGEIMSVRGNRSDGEVIIIDGVRVRGGGYPIVLPAPSQGIAPVTESQILFYFNKAVCPDLKGRVSVSFIVNAQGAPSMINIAGSQCDGFEQELRRTLRLLGKLGNEGDVIVLNLYF
ncbi:hypothetical protein LJC53_01365 [Bacteroidales bacterium OttesenSCG-928-C03]|nr:hypothetical protein [Bacteroidales bacterium OttesenSCG-928-C03]